MIIHEIIFIFFLIFIHSELSTHQESSSVSSPLVDVNVDEIDLVVNNQ
jgi:hypothetical protein